MAISRPESTPLPLTPITLMPQGPHGAACTVLGRGLPRAALGAAGGELQGSTRRLTKSSLRETGAAHVRHGEAALASRSPSKATHVTLLAVATGQLPRTATILSAVTPPGLVGPGHASGTGPGQASAHVVPPRSARPPGTEAGVATDTAAPPVDQAVSTTPPATAARVEAAMLAPRQGGQRDTALEGGPASAYGIEAARAGPASGG